MMPLIIPNIRGSRDNREAWRIGVVDSYAEAEGKLPVLVALEKPARSWHRSAMRLVHDHEITRWLLRVSLDPSLNAERAARIERRRVGDDHPGVSSAIKSESHADQPWSVGSARQQNAVV